MGIQKLGISLAENIVKATRTIAQDGHKVGYSRLKRVFTSGQNYSCYDELVLSTKNKILGNIPKEIIDIIVRLNPSAKGQTIKSAQNAFGNVARTLKGVELAEITALKNMTSREDEISFLLKEFYPNLRLEALSTNSKQIIGEANSAFTESISNILQANCRTNLEYLGSGQFGNAYRLSILDEAGNNIIHNRVIKVFKDDHLNVELAALKRKKIKELLSKYKDDELFEIYKSTPVQSNSKFKFSIKVSDEQKKQTFINSMRSKRIEYEGMNVDSLEKDFLMQTRAMRDCHGLYAEANSTFRLKNILGHNMSKTDAVNTDMYDLDIGYSISQFSDNLLPKTTSKIDFYHLGLDYGDSKKANYVADRLIDFGGITKETEELADKIVLRYYKKIMNRTNPKEQAELIQQYKRLLDNPKTPHRENIEKAIQIAERRIQRGVKLNNLSR